MHTTNELLDAVKTRHTLTSDYKLRQRLDVAENTLRNYRSGGTRPDESVAMKLADLLDMDPLYVVACINAERSKEPRLRAMWQGVATKLQAATVAAVAVILSFFVGGGPDAGAQAAPVPVAQVAADTEGGLYIMSNRLRQFLARLIRRLRRLIPSREDAAGDAFGR